VIAHTPVTAVVRDANSNVKPPTNIDAGIDWGVVAVVAAGRDALAAFQSPIQRGIGWGLRVVLASRMANLPRRYRSGRV